MKVAVFNNMLFKIFYLFTAIWIYCISLQIISSYFRLKNRSYPNFIEISTKFIAKFCFLKIGYLKILFITLPVYLFILFGLPKIKYFPLNYVVSIVFIILIFLFYALICRSIFIIRTKDDVKSKYEKGACRNWYDSNLEFIGVNWSEDIYNQILNNTSLIKKENFVFVSPSANRGVYEEHLFKYICSKRKNNLFILSDICRLEKHVQDTDNTEVNSKLLYFEEVDAANINDTLEKVNVQKVDVIYDIKGYLWYFSSTMDIEKRFNTYLEILNEDGIIILDDYNNKKSLWILHNLIQAISKKTIGFAERSTWTRIQEHINKNENLKEYFDMHFVITEVRSNSNPIIKFICLHKKS